MADRGASATERTDASFDGLTGAYLRGPGFAELAREITRAKRTQHTLVVAFVDVDRLKAINDAGGHGAGDRALIAVTSALRARVRSYDLVIRYGGDEFVCVLPDLHIADAELRFADVNTTLAEGSDNGRVTVGFAQLQQDDTLESLVERADAALYRRRRECE